MKMTLRVMPRWRKILREVWVNRTRTILVVLSIAVGVFSVGVVRSTQDLLTREMDRNWERTVPASARLNLSPFGYDFVESVRRMPEIEDAEGRSSLYVRVSSNQDARLIQLHGLGKFNDQHLSKIFPEQAGMDAWPPPRRTILLERNALALLDVAIGDEIELDMPNNQKYRVRIAGTVHNPEDPGPAFLEIPSGYVSMETMAYLGQPALFTTLLYRVAEDQGNRDHVQAIADVIKTRVQRDGGVFYGADVPQSPGQHPFADAVQAVLLIMTVLGVLSLIMSAFLVINTVTAVLTEQVRQIGMMKAVGARSQQLARMYVTLVLIFGGLSLLVAVPLGAFVARLFVDFLGGLLNLNVSAYDTPAQVIALELAIGLIAPVIAAAQPILSNTRRTVRETISDYGIGNVSQNGLARNSKGRLLLRKLIRLPHPALLSLRNTFRRKGRLILTMSTLILGGGIFIGVFSVRESLLKTLDISLAYWNYDVEVNLAGAYPSERIERAALAVPGVVKAEAWGFANARRIYEDRSEGIGLVVVAPPAETDLLRPILLRGRWLMAEDQDAVVVNSEVLQTESDLKIGDTLQLKVNGTQRASLRVVGIVQGVMTGRMVYVNKPYFSNKIVMTGNKAENLQLLTQQHDIASQNQTAQALKEEFRRVNIKVGSASTTGAMRVAILNQFNVIIAFLLLMAVLIAIVGGLGLAGTMSINVLERTREIGVMRAIGATSRSVRGIVIREGLVIGGLSWLIGTALAVPISRTLSDAIGDMLLQEPLFYTFGWSGLVIWLGLILTIAALASALPAWRAARLTVREVLAYT